MTRRLPTAEKLKQSEERFRRLVDVMPVAVYECDRAGMIQSYNKRAVQLWGREPEPGDLAQRYCGSLRLYALDGKLVPHEESKMAEVLRTGIEARDQEVVIERPDGSRITVLVNIVPLRNGDGEVVGALNCFLDITERKREEEASRHLARKLQELSAQKEDHLRLVINTIPVMVWSLSSDGDLDFVNQRWLEFTGLSSEEALEVPNGIVHPDDLPRVLENWRPDMAGGKPSEDEMRLRRADGEYRWFLVRTVPLCGERGDIVKWYGTSTDIEDRKRAEEKLKTTSEQLRALSARLRSAREEESTRIAREVHDEIGQALTALQMDVAWLGRKLDASGSPDPENLAAKLRSMSELIDETIGAVQRIATDLRPGVLDELGLEAAIEWHVREFENRTGIACRLHSDLGGVRVDSKRAMTIFRILQEALTNVARHSGSTSVDIRLTADRDRLRLEVEDDGRGLPEDRREVVQSLGVLGMRERARSLGGDLSIGRASRSGTVVTLTIPP